jgi:hypothetical protein
MIDLGTYTTKELCEALNIKPTSFKSHKQKFLKDYQYIETKLGRSKAYTIIGYKEKEKSEFIKLCEKVAGTEVYFPKESTAEKILKVLFQEDCTILDYEEIGYEIPGTLERHTIGRYIDLFRKYKILPPILPKVPRLIFNKETGEFFSKSLDPNKYTFYIVSREFDFREEINESEYYEMRRFIDEKYSEYLTFFLLVLEDEKFSKSERIKIIKEYKSDAIKLAYSDCLKTYGGIPKKAVSKVPTKEAYDVFSGYFNLERVA